MRRAIGAIHMSPVLQQRVVALPPTECVRCKLHFHGITYRGHGVSRHNSKKSFNITQKEDFPVAEKSYLGRPHAVVTPSSAPRHRMVGGRMVPASFRH